jgi:CHAT domain-containing protein
VVNSPLVSPSNALRGLLLLWAALLCVASDARVRPANAARPARAIRLPPGAGVGPEEVNSQAEALLALSQQQNYDDHALALQTAQEALALWQASGDGSGMARAYAQVARCHFAQSELSEATENYQRALQLWRDLNKPGEQAEVLVMMGFVEVRKGEWSNAISFLTQAQGLTDEENDPYRMGQISAQLADIFNDNGMPETALVRYQQAQGYYRRAANARGEARMVLNLGVTYFLLGNVAESLAHLQQALDAFAPGSLDAASCHQQLGRVYVSTREHDAALMHLQSALTIYERTSNPGEAAEVRSLMGQVYQQQGRLEPARQKYLQALSVFNKLSDRVNQAAACYALGSLELLARDYAAAEGYLRHSIELTEDIRRTPPSSDMTTTFSATVHERYEKYIECLMLQSRARPAGGLVERAFESSEQGHAHALAEILSAAAPNFAPGLDPALAEQERSLRQALRAKEDYRVVLLSGAHNKGPLDALEADLTRLEAEYRRVTDAVRARCPSCEQLAQPTAWSLGQIQKEVVADDETVLLEYSLGEDRSYVWAVTRDKISSYELPERARVEESARGVYKLLTTPPGTEPADALPPALRELSQMVLAPVAAELKKRQVIVVADGALNYIPFQALPAPAADGVPLVASCEVSNAPSASILGTLREETSRRQPTPKVLAAFGDPVVGPRYALHKDDGAKDDGADEQSAAAAELEEGRLISALRDTGLNGDSFDPSALRPLFYAKRELKSLRDVASEDEIFVAADFAATRERLLGANLTQYAILHFATHGLFDTKRPESSGLVLSMVGRDGRPLNGFVGLQDVYSLRAPVDLVVLSACQTALGRDVRGEGLVGLTRGFMYAGASSVVASLWQVEDKATAELMKQFYANMLQKGMPPGAALREAQNSIRQTPRWRSPYYWAAFTLQGEYNHAIRHKPRTPVSRMKIAVGVFLVTLLMAAAWWYLRLRSRAARVGA